MIMNGKKIVKGLDKYYLKWKFFKLKSFILRKINTKSY
jgi:hypothetical protein